MEDERPDSAAAWQRVGAQLRAARERQGLTLRDLSVRTKIKDALLDAIECGDADRVPRGPFHRGFARAYARELGLDPDVLLAEFRSEPVVVIAPSRSPSVESRLAPATVAGRLLLGVAVMTAAVILPRWTMAPEEPATARELPVVGAVATTGVQPVDEVSPAAHVPGTQPQAAAVTFALRATDEVWVEATADGERLVYGLLPRGTERTFVARKTLALRIGNAGAAEYSINGSPRRLLGAAGQVRDLQLTPENTTALR